MVFRINFKYFLSYLRKVDISMFSTFDKIKELCQKQGISLNQLEEKLNFSTNYLYSMKKGNPKADNLQKIADYFGVTIDYLMTGIEDKKESPVLTARDERDIAKDLNRIMEKLSAGEEGPASYDGEELDPEAAELFRDELNLALRRLKIVNKEKYGRKKK